MTACAKSTWIAGQIGRFVTLLVFAFLSVLLPASPAHAQQNRTVNPYGADVEITVSLREQRSQLGEISLHISKDGKLSLSPLALVAALGTRVTSEASQDLMRLSTSDGRASFLEFRELGFELTFNEAELDLSITIPVTARPNRDYSIRGPQSDEIGGFDPVAGFSIAANLRMSGDYNHSDLDSDLSWAGNLGLLGRVAGLAYQANFRFSQTDRQLLRENTRFIYDDVARALRWQIGDVQPFAGSTVGGEDILGIGVSRETEALQPNHIARLRATQTFSIQETSEVIVSVNGRVVTRRFFPPGNYNIADFPFVQGRNQVDVVIVNSSGQQERLSFNQFLDSRLLELGRDNFGIVFGITSTPGYRGPRSYDESNWALNAHYIKGVTEHLTAGVSTAITSERSTFLATAVHAGRAGATSGRVGFTSDKNNGDIGVVGIGIVRALGTSAIKTPGQTVRIGLDSRFDFSGSGRNLVNASFGYAWPLTKTISANLDFRVSGRSGSSSFQTSIGLTSEIRLDIAVDWRFGEDPNQRGPAISIGVSRRFGRDSQGRARYDSRLGEGRIAVSSSAADGLGHWSTNVEAAASDRVSSLNVASSSFFNRVEVAGQASSTWQNGRNIRRLGVRSGAALAFVGGHFAIGRPVADSFAIIGGHKSLGGRIIGLRSQTSDANPIAETGFFGPALVTGLGTYTPKIISVTVEDPPAGYDVGSGTFRVMPPLFGGYRFVVGSDAANSIIGTLMLPNGKTANLAVGAATSIDWPQREPIVVFTNANGQFSLAGLGLGRWLLKMRDIETPFEFVIEPSATNFIELGIVRAKVIQ